MNDKEKAMLEWCLRLTYSGMTLDMVRYWMLKKHHELLALSRDADPDLVVQVGAEEERNERGPV
jgi:hypothetical protein